MSRHVTLGLIAILFGMAQAQAADDEAEKALAKIAALGPGVHAVKTDKKGQIVSCIAVGQARISTVLGTAKGIQIAREKAEMDAKGQFSKWLSEKVSIRQSSEDESILLMEGSGEGAPKESGKAIEKSSTKYESVSKNLIRGLQVLHVEQSGKDATYTVVLGWDAATAKALKGGKEPGPAEAKPATAAKDTGSKIPDKSVTSPDAKKFLP